MADINVSSTDLDWDRGALPFPFLSFVSFETLTSQRLSCMYS